MEPWLTRKGIGRGDGERDVRPGCMKRPPRFRAGSKMLVREVKVLVPDLGRNEGEALLAGMAACEREIQEEQWERAGQELDRVLAPLLRGPGYKGDHRKTRLLLLLGGVGLAIILAGGAFLLLS